MCQATAPELERLAEIMELLTLTRGQVTPERPGQNQPSSALVLALTDVGSVGSEGEREKPRALELSTDEDGWPLAFGLYLKGVLLIGQL